MIRDFTKEELAPAENDTELTLGAGAFLAIGGGLLLLCSICFGLGYVVGHRGSTEQGITAALPAQDAPAPMALSGSSAKPGAAAQAVQTQSVPITTSSVDGTGQGTAQVEQVAAVAGPAQSTESPVHPALVAQTQPAQSQVPQSQVQGWMVQIAAVSHVEDAQVLVDALRKRGYEVSARRVASDNLIHVQTGPFVNRNDANAMRQKLLNDGYNAIVQ